MAVRPTRRTRIITETVIIGCDHQGFAMKEFVKAQLIKRRFNVKDVGAFTGDEPSDYPVHVAKVASAVSSGAFRRGIAIDGTGVGASVVANRFPHVRAALCNDIGVARLSRAHADANILVLAGRLTPDWLAEQILDAWLTTSFEGGRHQRRVSLIDDNTQLAIALHHLDQLDPKRIDPSLVAEPFAQRAIKGLQRIVNLFTAERRGMPETRMSEARPSTITCDGRKYAAMMTDLSSKGAQFRFQGSDRVALMEDDVVECDVKTQYGLAQCSGVVRWVDGQSRSIGVVFTKLSKDPKDPLRLLQDSML